MAKRGRKKAQKPPPLGLNGLSADDQRRLTNFVMRIERLRDDRKVIDEDIRDVMSEAKAMNFHPRTINTVIAERTPSAEERQMRAALRDTYRHALGMLADTPLGRSALVRENGAADDAPAADRPVRKRKPHKEPQDRVTATAESPVPDPELAGSAANDMVALRKAMHDETQP